MSAFARKFYGFFSLGISKSLQYRFNFISDSILQPFLVVIIEVVLWMAVFRFSSSPTLGNFGKEYYMAYFILGSFAARINSNWSYEHEMISSIESGAVNSAIVRPMTFYEYYLGQFFGYKTIAALPAIIFPILICEYFNLPFHLERVPVVIALSAVYLVFLYTMSFCVACLAFWLARVRAFTGAKNIALWAFTGELYPLDLAPESVRQFMIMLPFANGVYIPVGFLTGRFGFDMVVQGFISLLVGIAVFGLLAVYMWRSGLKAYSGTGA